MKETSDITACVIDHGLYIPLARSLARSYKRVLYFTPWETGYATINNCCLGDGFDDIERCDDIWSVLEEVDLWIFPDIMHGGLQHHLRDMGCNVWGSGRGSELETDRLLFLKTLQDVGLNLPTVTEVRGISHLREHLSGEKDKYIKISKYRGTMETWHWRDWDLDAPCLDALAVNLGTVRELVRFLVFDAIDTDIEVGGDTYCVDGQFPSHIIEAYEAKDKGSFGAFKAREEAADVIQEVLLEFGPVLEDYSYRNFFSMELRVKDGEGYFIDPCCRGPMPLTCSQIELYANLPEIIWAGAHGELINADPAARFCCECALTAKAGKDEWTNVKVPPELERWMKINYCCQADGVLGLPPNEMREEHIGWLVSVGDTPKETLETQIRRSKLVPDGICCHTESLVELLKEIQEAEAQGLELSAQPTPEPEDAI